MGFDNFYDKPKQGEGEMSSFKTMHCPTLWRLDWERLENKLIDFSHGSIPLSEVSLEDVKESIWLYDRKFGFFYVQCGCHDLLSSLLYCLRNVDDYHKVIKEVGACPYEGITDYILGNYLTHHEEYSEEWLTYPGSCYKSAAFTSAGVQTWDEEKLTSQELEILGSYVGFRSLKEGW